MCNCEKREMTKEEANLMRENLKIREENTMQAEHINCLMKQIDELAERVIELPETPIECATFLINAGREYELSPMTKVIMPKEKGWEKLYSVSELRQIAEHLIVYCNYTEEE